MTWTIGVFSVSPCLCGKPAGSQKRAAAVSAFHSSVLVAYARAVCATEVDEGVPDVGADGDDGVADFGDSHGSSLNDLGIFSYFT